MNYHQEICNHLLCLSCGNQALLLIDQEKIACNECKETYVFTHNVLDALNSPSAATISELKGMAIESNIKEEDYNSFKIRKHEKISGLAEKLEATKNDPSNYYLQTQMNFEQALAEIGDYSNKKVLEIGSCFDYYFLNDFKNKNCDCYAVNIHFDVNDDERYQYWPKKIIADMNQLPFKNGSFDIVIISATSHHSVTPDVLVSEINRVLVKGGHCLMINDPTWGIIKNLGGPDNTVAFRESHINENEYPIWRYNKMFRSNGFQYKQLFSHFYDDKLTNMEISPKTRFSLIAKAIKFFWKFSFLRFIIRTKLLWFAQAITGFPMNVVLKKIK